MIQKIMVWMEMEIRLQQALREVPAEYQSAVADVRKPETLKALLGSAYTDTMSVVDVKDVTVADGTVFPVTIRFNV